VTDTTLAGLSYNQAASLDSGFAAGVDRTAATTIAAAPSPSNSGTWTIFPGLLSINWDYDATAGTADIKVVFLFWTIDSLTGTLKAGSASLKDDLELGVVSGDVEVDATFPSPGGIDIKGSLSLFGAPKGSFDIPLAKW